MSPPRRRRLVLFSHLPSGNVHAFAKHAPEAFFESWDVRFLYIDPKRYRSAPDGRVRALLALDPRHAIWIARSDVVLCTHGPGVLRILMAGGHGPHFVDVWHGIGFKDRTPYLEEMRGFSLLLAPSEWTAGFLTQRGVDPSGLAVTGYGVWDSLLDPDEGRRWLQEVGLAEDRRPRVLVAPTWTNSALWEQPKVFGGTWEELAPALDRWAARAGALVLFRSHLNAGQGLDRPLQNLLNVPFSEHPDTAAVLSATDVLVTDWSSIANDFLPAGRPIVYLDVPAPYRIGHLDADDRPGPQVSSVDDLLSALDEAVSEPAAVLARHAEHRRAVEGKVCGSMADGHAVDRYVEALERLVPPR